MGTGDLSAGRSPNPVVPGVKARSWLLSFVILGIAYGSLHPFVFRWPTDFAAALGEFAARGIKATTVGDTIGNILLFVPLGVLAGGGRGNRRGKRALFVLTTGTGFALALQLLQFFVPGRDAAWIDVMMNSVGLLLGLATAPLLGWALRRPPFVAKDALVPAGIVVLWVMSELAPLVPTLDWQAVKDAVRPLFAPLRALADWPSAVLVAGQAVALFVALDVLTEGRRAKRLLILLLVTTLALKPFVIGQRVELFSVAGMALGCLLVLLAPRSWTASRTAGTAALLLIGAYVLDALRPFEIRRMPADFGWVPFAAVLTEFTPRNVVSLLGDSFSYVAVLWLTQRARGTLMPATIALAVLVFLLEVGQKWIESRYPDLTEVLLVCVSGLLLHWSRALRSRRATPAANPAVISPRGPPCEKSGSSSHPWLLSGRSGWRRSPDRAAAVALVFTWAALTAGTALLLRVPRIPYNVREMFHGDGNLLFISAFAALPLWIGISASAAAEWTLRSRRPFLAFHVSVLVGATIALLLLLASVSMETISDIAGSNNLWWWVTNRDMWGPGARNLFAVIGPDAVGFLERPVRFSAIYVPPVLFITAFLFFERSSSSNDWTGLKVAGVLASSVPLLWLCKAVAFDWSSTDNLNELIARQGALGLGGGAYLYLLLALFGGSVALLARIRLSFVGSSIAAASLVISTVVGWWLLNLGLEPEVEKYSLIFSGVQFLLGPDRSSILGEDQLFFRWVLVYVVGVVSIALGARFGNDLLLAWIRGSRFQVGS